MNKNQVYMAIIGIIIIGLLLVGFLYYSWQINQPNHSKPKQDEKTIDARISPLTNQGLTVEIKRIRHRSLLDEIFKISYIWKDPPQSYWVTIVDDKECNSKGNVGYGSSGFFTNWDTIFQDCRVNYKIEDGKNTSDVKISIMELKKTGLLGLKSTEVVKEEISLLYDYRTGRWNGDDFFKDEDGYGHYLGSDVEIWFNIYQSDYDHDGIPYWTEVNVLNTDPRLDDSQQDPDEDGIPTSWEWKWGYDPFTWEDHTRLDPDIDGVENIEEYMMRKYFANPFQPDIYIETDGMQKKNIFDLNHIFFKDSQQMIIERFAQHGINVYIDDGWADGPINGGGELLPFIKEIDEVVGGQIAGFYNHHFADERKEIFRYVVIANKKGWNTPCEFNKYDTILVYSGWVPTFKNYFAVTPRLRSILLAKGVLHEMGHSMGLMPYTFKGNDIMDPVGIRYPNMDEEEYKRYLEEYHSIMNYNYIYKDRKLFDYSDGSNGHPYDQNDWEYLYLPSFQSDARAYEEPIDETFEDFEVMDEEIYPAIEDWYMIKNLSKRYIDLFKSFVYSDLHIDTDFIILTTNDTAIENNVRVYVRPDITPFPVIQSWTLIAEGKRVLEGNDDFNFSFYSFEDELSDILTS